MTKPAKPVVTTLGWVPEFARGLVRDIRPRWALEETGQPYDVELIKDSKSAEYRARQPFGQVPLYRDENGELFESGAMVLRIAERGGTLLPADPAARSRAIQWMIAALNSVEPFVMALVLNDVFEADCEWSEARHAKVEDRLQTRLGELEAALGDKKWLDGDQFTIGDLMTISVLGALRNTGQLDRRPKLAEYVRRGETRPSHKKAMADHLATFEQPALAE